MLLCATPACSALSHRPPEMTDRYRDILQHLLEGKELDPEGMRYSMTSIFENLWTPAQTAAFLVSLRIKGESAREIADAARVMREKVIPVEGPDPSSIVDVVGTGGDGKKTFNISTTAAFIAAAAGVRVAKHCNRALSSTSGSSDVLTAFGVDISRQSPEDVSNSIEQIGIGFMFAPNHHVALKHAAPVRRELGVRTIFNVLGPLTNPASARRQMTGVFDEALVDVYAETLRDLGSERALIVHGDGMDEITVTGGTIASELKEDGSIHRLSISPEDFGFELRPLGALQVASPEQSKAMVEGVLEGEKGACREAALMSAGAAIYISGAAAGLREGAEKAAEAVDSGSARRKFEEFCDRFAHEAS